MNCRFSVVLGVTKKHRGEGEGGQERRKGVFRQLLSSSTP